MNKKKNAVQLNNKDDIQALRGNRKLICQVSVTGTLVERNTQSKKTFSKENDIDQNE